MRKGIPAQGQLDKKAMFSNAVEQKEPERCEIASDVERFLACGGEITECDPTESGEPKDRLRPVSRDTVI